jgi:DNA mismatch repair ATPase MutS
LVELRAYKRGGAAIAETNRLFEQYGEDRDDPAWQSPDGEKFSKYKQRSAVSTLQRLQTELIHHITERTAELELLHRRVGQETAKAFLNSIKQRSKALDNLVQEYNKVARVAGVRPLDAGDLRENGLDNDEM